MLKRILCFGCFIITLNYTSLVLAGDPAEQPDRGFQELMHAINYTNLALGFPGRQPDRDYQELMHVIRAGKPEKVSELICQGVSYCDQADQPSALYEAIDAGNFDVFSEILNYTFPPGPNHLNMSIGPVVVAIAAATRRPPGEYDNRIIDALLKHPKIDPTGSADFYITMLLKELKTCSNVREKTTRLSNMLSRSSNALTIAIVAQRLDLVQLLLSNERFDSNLKRIGGESDALCAAIKEGNFDVFSEILKYSSLPAPAPANPIIKNELVVVAIDAATTSPPGEYDNRIIDALLNHQGIAPMCR